MGKELQYKLDRLEREEGLREFLGEIGLQAVDIVMDDMRGDGSEAEVLAAVREEYKRLSRHAGLIINF